MRRLIDSVIFALVAYTLLWPIVRGLTSFTDTAVEQAAPRWSITGRYEATSKLQLVLQKDDSQRALDVVCDPDGHFRVSVDEAPSPGAVLQVRDERGDLLETLTLNEQPNGLIDLGLLD